MCTFVPAPVANPLGGPGAAHLRNDLDKSRNQDVKDLCVYALGTLHSAPSHVGPLTGHSTFFMAVTFAHACCTNVPVSVAGIHNAGMLRHDRNLTERLFTAGVVKVRPV